MPCPRCQHESPSGQKFCGECGARLATPCSACGASNPPDQKFCGECGTALTGVATSQKFGAPETYTPKHLAEKILTSKSAQEGERKHVTVLFADLKGSMELLADRDPEEARKVLGPVLERMMEAVHYYEGTVNQVMGDGIMALFGAPIGHEDHAVRACYAALRMHRRVTLFADEIQRRGGTPVQIRAGLNSGEVVVRAIGSDLHMDYTAVGQTTHLAARMEQMAKAGSTLVTGNTLKLAEGYVLARPLGAVPVKGLEMPTAVYELTGSVPARSRLQASAARGLTRFVGRDGEVQQLAQALERAAAGHGQAVAVVGEAGVGKSRLVWEFTRSHRIQDWLVLESGSVSYGRATPYLPVIELLKAYFRVRDRDDPREIRERVAGKLLMLDRALESVLTPLLALLDVPVDDAPWHALEPPQRRQGTLDAVKRLLLRESQVQPLLLLFEDLHWIDSETQALLDSLMESLPTARVLLLVNYRPEYQHAWGRKSYYLQLRIDPLLPESADALLTALLGHDRTLEPLKRVLIERTAGNPFFLEESVQTLVETAVLAGERGAYRMTKARELWQIPATAQAILAARIDRLPAEEKRLLQAASVIGKDVSFALLHAIADTPEDTFRLELSHLQGAEFLYETRLYPDLEYTFKHAFTHEVAYGSVLHERRRTLHAKIASTIEALYPDRLTEHVEQLAHHAFLGELWDRGVAYLRQAGAKAFARSANRDSATYFEQALEALTHLPETRETVEQGIDIRFDLRNVLYMLGELGRCGELLRQAERLARTLDDARRLGWAHLHMSQNFFFMDDTAPQRASAEQAWAIGQTLGDVPLQVAASYLLATACVDAGDYRRAEALLGEVVQSLDGDLARERCGLYGFPAVLARCFLTRTLAERGAFADGLVSGREAVRLAEALGHAASLGHAFWLLGYLHGLKGDFSEAVRLHERGLAVSREAHILAQTVHNGGALGHVLVRSGRVEEGLDLLRSTEEARLPFGTGIYLSKFLVDVGEAYLVTGRLDDARVSGDRALALARELGQRGHETHALRLLGEIASQGDLSDAQAAEGRYREALLLADELGMRPLVAHCHLGLGRLYRRTTDGGKIGRHLTSAATLYREMDMGFYLTQAEAELGPTR